MDRVGFDAVIMDYHSAQHWRARKGLTRYIRGLEGIDYRRCCRRSTKKIFCNHWLAFSAGAHFALTMSASVHWGEYI